ncbi:suppressor of fused domain protein [Aneurinibacillus sp. REN35]|uniref:suppressor of fused domain protein n=1 Tax=Aneurinibacillus sp. REN35 TaxID=3237286 RepID=UPI003527C089
MSYEEEEALAPGWEAINHAFATLYPHQEPKHYGTLIKYAFGGPDPLDGISAYTAEEPIPHWHFVTYGFSELYEKESEDTEYSGFGFELTFRLRKDIAEEEPPRWALHFLQNIGRYVFQSGNVFAQGHYMDLNGPIAVEENTTIRAITFVMDPQLEPLHTPNGRVELLQVVGITPDELTAIQSWSGTSFLPLLATNNPQFITDLSRASVLHDPAIQQKVEEGIAAEGSSTGVLFVDQLDWQEQKKLLAKNKFHIAIGAKQANLIGTILASRIRNGKSLALAGTENHISFVSSEQNRVEGTPEDVTIYIRSDTADEIAAALSPKEQSIELPSWKQLIVHIVKTEIRNQQGEIVEVIG